MANRSHQVVRIGRSRTQRILFRDTGWNRDLLWIECEPLGEAELHFFPEIGGHLCRTPVEATTRKNEDSPCANVAPLRERKKTFHEI